MIRIDRTRGVAPPELSRDGAADLPRLQALRKSGTLVSTDFKKSIYGTEALKEALWDMQDNKCCFCEREYERKWSTVEHFRPKAKAKAANGKEQWGYWWLAYSFENLYFACQNCNQPKGAWFPLSGRARRYKPGELPSGVAYREPTLILDPGVDDPEQHLKFVPHPVTGRWRLTHLDERGDWTVRAAQLDRDDLNTLRDKHVARYLQPVLDRAQRGANVSEEVHDLCHPSTPFALLARCYFRHHGLWP